MSEIIKKFSNIEDLIKYQYKYPLSYSDMEKIANGKLKIILYTDLEKIKDINELFNPYGGFIVLYQSTPSFGHWVSILRVDSKTIEHFDPYGYSLDEELKFCQKMELKPWLSALIKQSKYKNVICNNLPLQSKNTNISTCGRWAVIRQILKDYPLKDFINLFKKTKLEPDFYITALTMFV